MEIMYKAALIGAIVFFITAIILILASFTQSTESNETPSVFSVTDPSRGIYNMHHELLK